MRRRRSVQMMWFVAGLGVAAVPVASISSANDTPLDDPTTREIASSHYWRTEITPRQIIEALAKATATETPDYSGKNLSFLDLANIDFKGAKLAKADLFGADLTGTSLKGSDLSGVRLDRATVLKSDFSGANLEGASMMRPAVNVSLDRNSAEAPKFAGAKLRGIRMTAMMDGADFRGADLTDAKLGPHEPRADISSMPSSLMRGSDFSGATLLRADLMWAKLAFSRFVGADLREVNLVGADLSMTDLSGADLTGADLTDADFDGAKLSGVRGLDKARGLDRVKNLRLPSGEVAVAPGLPSPAAATATP
jgi:uncharacterized protein YjbI with pentapeptide repeats